MRRLLVLGLVLAAAVPLAAQEAEPFKLAAISTENVPPVPAELFERLRRYRNVRSASFRGWAPQGEGILVATRFGNTTQLHRVLEPGGRRMQITFLDEPVDGRFVPESPVDAIVLSASRGGDENDQLHYLDHRSVQGHMLTDGESKNDLGPFSEDGAFVVVRSNRRNGTDFDLFVADPRIPGSLVPLLETTDEYWTAQDWSPVGNTLLLNRYVSINETYPALLSWQVVFDEQAANEAAIERALAADESLAEAREQVEILKAHVARLAEVLEADAPALVEARAELAAAEALHAELLPARREAVASELRAAATRLDVERLDLPRPEGEKIAYGDMEFSKDGRHVYAATDADSDQRQLVRIRLADFSTAAITPHVPWDVEEVEIAPAEATKGAHLVAFTVNFDGASDLYLLADDPEGAMAKRDRQLILASRVLPANEPVRLRMPPGIVSSLEFSPDGRRLGFTFAPADGPSDAYSIDLRTGALDRWTYSEVGGLDPERFVAPEPIAYESFDGRKIPAYVFAPPEASPEDPVPVVISIHGGPESQYRPYFSATDQFLASELGFAVIHPNVRGSAGYGKAYLQLDNGPLREDSVKDIGALLDWIATQPRFDASRVAVTGGSYGGYMVLASLTHFPDRLRAGVDYVGIASFRTFLENTQSYRRDLRRAEYGDERDPEMAAVFERIDPLNNVSRIESALLVAHGANDPRVPISEARQIVAAAREKGLEPWTVYAGDEGHGFRKQANRDYLDAVTAMFLWEQLRGEKPQPQPE